MDELKPETRVQTPAGKRGRVRGLVEDWSKRSPTSPRWYDIDWDDATPGMVPGMVMEDEITVIPD